MDQHLSWVILVTLFICARVGWAQLGFIHASAATVRRAEPAWLLPRCPQLSSGCPLTGRMAWTCSCGSWVLKQQAGKLPCKLQSFFMTLLMDPIKCANGPWAKGSPVAEPRVRVGGRCQRAWTQEGRVNWSCCCCQSTRVGISKVW